MIIDNDIEQSINNCPIDPTHLIGFCAKIKNCRCEHKIACTLCIHSYLELHIQKTEIEYICPQCRTKTEFYDPLGLYPYDIYEIANDLNHLSLDKTIKKWGKVFNDNIEFCIQLSEEVLRENKR